MVAKNRPLVAIIMGSDSDWNVMKESANVLDTLDVAYEVAIVSAHRTPDRLFEFASSAEHRGFKVIIAGAGGAAHLPGMTASKTVVPVIGVPIPSKHLQGWDSLLSIVQMPGGIPVGDDGDWTVRRKMPDYMRQLSSPHTMRICVSGSPIGVNSRAIGCWNGMTR